MSLHTKTCNHAHKPHVCLFRKQLQVLLLFRLGLSMHYFDRATAWLHAICRLCCTRAVSVGHADCVKVVSLPSDPLPTCGHE